MTSIKAPASLRAGRIAGAREASSAGLAACLMVASSTMVLAQAATTTQPPAGGTPQAAPPASSPASAAPPASSPAATAPANPPQPAATSAPAASADQLPALTVEAKKKPASAPKPSSERPATKVNSAPAAQPAPQPAQPVTADTAGPAAPANANPYADPNAPYKVDRSSSAKFTEPLLDTPKTIVTVPKEVLEDKGATSIRELARTTPGVTLGAGEGGNPFGDRIFIRGFDSRNDVYINGIRDSGVPVRESFDVQQIEILKGPSSSVGGRGTTGGALNIVTKQAAEKDFFESQTTFGTDMTKRETLDYNKVLSKEWAVRINGLVQDAGVAGRDEVYDRRYGGAIALLFKPSDVLKFTADYYHLRMNQMPDWGVPWDNRQNRPITDSGIGVSRNNFYGFPQRDFQKNTQDMLTMTGEYKVNDQVTISNKFRYGFTQMDYVNSLSQNITRPNPLDPSTWTASVSTQSKFQQNEMLADQIDVTTKLNTFGIGHTVVVGAEVDRERIKYQSYSGLTSELFGVPTGNTLALNLLYPNPDRYTFATPVKSANKTELSIESQSGYIVDTIKLNENWILNGGVRVDHYDLHYASPVNFNQFRMLQRDDVMLNYNGGITFKPVPEGSLYVAYGTSSNPMGAEVDGTAADYGVITVGSALLAPEQNTSMEAGVKWELFQRHLLATAAVFQTEKDHAREISGNLTLDTGRYRVRGVELGWQGNITKALSIYGGAVVMETEVLKSVAASTIGLPLANVANRSFNLLAKYNVTDWFSIGGQATYRGVIHGGTLAAVNTRLEDAWRFDAMAEVKMNEHFSVKFLGQNLFDSTIYDALYRSPAPYVYVAPGRVGYMTLEVKY